MTVLFLWSAPRCRSTAFERMMAERGDHLVVHEPFSHLADFGVATVDGVAVRSAPALKARLRRLGAARPVFVKDTTDFRYPSVAGDPAFLCAATHTFLIRDPAAAVASHHRLNPNLSLDEIGFVWLYEIFRAVLNTTGTVPVVLDSDDLLVDPPGIISEYCERVGIPYDVGALSWRPSMLPQWQRTARWHTAVSETSGFVGSGPLPLPLLDRRLRSFAEYHRPYYRAMYAARLVPARVEAASV